MNKNKPYSNKDYENAKIEGLDLDNGNDYKRYFQIEEYADDLEDLKW